MKKKQNIRTLLGMSQENLALILQVSRSQIAMFEIGKRSLPVHAMEKLTTMLVHLQNEAVKSKAKKGISIEEQNYLKKLLLKNNHQQLLVERKITAIEKKQSAIAISNKLVSHLLKDKSKMNKNEFEILKAIERNNHEVLNYATSLLQLELKKEVLMFEEKLLRNKLQSIN